MLAKKEKKKTGKGLIKWLTFAGLRKLARGGENQQGSSRQGTAEQLLRREGWQGERAEGGRWIPRGTPGRRERRKTGGIRREGETSERLQHQGATLCPRKGKVPRGMDLICLD